MSNLQLSEYITRSGRRVVLKAVEVRSIMDAGGNKTPMQIFRGDLYRADGKTIESEHEWMPTLRQNVFGEHVNSNSTTQVASELDLVQHIG